MPPARAQHVVLRPFPSASWLVVAGQGLLAAGLAVAVWVFLQLAPAQPAGAVLWWPVVAVLTLFLYRAWQGRRPRGWTGGVSTLVGDGAAAGLGFAAASMLWLVPLTFGLGLAEITVRLFIGEVNQRALEFSLEAPPLATPALARLALWLPLGLAWACRARPGWRTLGLASLGSVLVACVPTRADPVDHPAALSISPAARLFHALCQFAAFFVRLGGQFGGQLPSLSRAEADSAQLTNGTHILSSTMSWTRLRLRRSPARCAPPRSARTYTYPCGDRLRLGACELSSVAPEDSPYHLTSPEGPTSASHSRSARASRSPTAPRVARAISSRGNLGVRSMYSSPLASWYVSANCV